jgi:hypothetical protein
VTATAVTVGGGTRQAVIASLLASDQHGRQVPLAAAPAVAASTTAPTAITDVVLAEWASRSRTGQAHREEPVRLHQQERPEQSLVDDLFTAAAGRLRLDAGRLTR